MTSKIIKTQKKRAQNLLLNKEYDFLTTNEHLNNNIILLTLSGSRAYGTSLETSDTDIRGIALNNKNEILLNKDFQQIQDKQTDTVVYSLNKTIKMLLSGAPNIIELLGFDINDYIYINNVGKTLIDNKEMFLSKNIRVPFCSYINSQIRTLKKSFNRAEISTDEKEIDTLNSIKCSLNTLCERYIPFNCLTDEDKQHIINNNSAKQLLNDINEQMKELSPKLSEMSKNDANLKLYIDKSQKENLNTEIFCDVDFKHYPVRDFVDFFNNLRSVIKTYEKLNNTGNKDDLHINKLSMHIIRAYLMLLDIFEKGEINTYRKNDIDLLMSIRNGEYRTENGVNDKYFDMLNTYEKRLQKAFDATKLPDFPNYEKIDELKMNINEQIVLNANEKNIDNDFRR